MVPSDSHLWLVLGFQVAAGTGPLCEQPPGSAVDEARSNGVGGIHRVCCVSCSGPRTWHDSALLGGIVFVALPSFCAGGAAGAPRGATAFFVNIRSEESKCKEGYAGSCHFACSQAVRPKDELKVRIRQSNWRTTFSSSSLRSTPPIPLAT